MKLHSTLATLAVALSPAATFADHHKTDTPASADAALGGRVGRRLAKRGQQVPGQVSASRSRRSASGVSRPE